jgi:hypothetical protein
VRRVNQIIGDKIGRDEHGGLQWLAVAGERAVRAAALQGKC